MGIIYYTIDQHESTIRFVGVVEKEAKHLL
jgi:hypothetical protein